MKTMYVCIVDGADQVLVHRNIASTPTAFLEIVEPYRDGLIVAVECMFTWYWLADNATLPQTTSMRAAWRLHRRVSRASRPSTRGRQPQVLVHQLIPKLVAGIEPLLQRNELDRAWIRVPELLLLGRREFTVVARHRPCPSRGQTCQAACAPLCERSPP